MDEVFVWPDTGRLLRIGVRLVAAVVLGGLIGLEREKNRRAAGLRTHMLVALGAAVFTLAPQEAGMPIADLAHVLQGVVTGIGFVGAGAILKVSADERVVGVTTAASVWLTAAVGSAVAIGSLWLPALAVALALLILVALRRLERSDVIARPG